MLTRWNASEATVSVAKHLKEDMISLIFFVIEAQIKLIYVHAPLYAQFYIIFP